MKKIVALIVLFSIVVFAQQDGSFTDNRDGKTYKWVKIGTQTWMAENLNYNAIRSGCYKNDPANCQIYGNLYDQAMAQVICPTGWHLPNNKEWEALIKTIGGKETAGKLLKATSGWKSGNGTDTYGFNALPGGHGGGFGSGYNGNWWSANSACYLHMNGDYEVVYAMTIWAAFSVRCLQNEQEN